MPDRISINNGPMRYARQTLGVLMIPLSFLVFVTVDSNNALAQSKSHFTAIAKQQTKGRPSHKSLAVRINGQNKYFTFTRFEQSPFLFTTYVPQGFREEYLASDEGYAMRWVYGSEQGDEGASLHIFFPNHIKGEASARAQAREVAVSNGSLVTRPAGSPKHYRGSLAEYDYVRQTGDIRLVGTILLGRHGRRYFTVIIQQVEGQKEEFMPLANRLLDEVVWKDTKKRR